MLLSVLSLNKSSWDLIASTQRQLYLDLLSCASVLDLPSPTISLLFVKMMLIQQNVKVSNDYALLVPLAKAFIEICEEDHTLCYDTISDSLFSQGFVDAFWLFDAFCETVITVDRIKLFCRPQMVDEGLENDWTKLDNLLKMHCPSLIAHFETNAIDYHQFLKGYKFPLVF